MSVLASDLSLRVHRKGGDVASSVHAEPTDWPNRAHKSVVQSALLIHGFNVTQCDACYAYENFLYRLPDSFHSISRFFWAGDEVAWHGSPQSPKILNKAYTALKYADQITSAKISAERLFKFITDCYRKTGCPKEIVLIAHSLGCRLTLELLKLIDINEIGKSFPRIRLVCLMAAAVPVKMVEKGGDLEPVEKRKPEILINLYSQSDSVLRLTFPPGQSLARLRNIEKQFHREAVGLNGNPTNMTKHRYHNQLAGHSDYWSSYMAVMYVSTLLGISTPRHLAEGRIKKEELPEHWLDEGHITPEHKLPGQDRSMCKGCPPKKRVAIH